MTNLTSLSSEYVDLAGKNAKLAEHYRSHVWPSLKAGLWRNAWVAFRIAEGHDVARVVFQGIAQQIENGGVVVS